jgi:hypothetical protein
MKHQILKKIKSSVYLIAAFERNAKVFWFRDAYSQQYNAIIAQNRDKIGMQLYGHGHTDSFRLIKDETGKVWNRFVFELFLI